MMIALDSKIVCILAPSDSGKKTSAIASVIKAMTIAMKTTGPCSPRMIPLAPHAS